MVPKFLDFSRSRLIADIMATYETKYSRVMTGDLLSKIIKLPEALRDMFYLIHHHIAVDIIIHLCTQDTSTGFIRVSDTYTWRVVWCIINYPSTPMCREKNSRRTTYTKRSKTYCRTYCRHSMQQKEIERGEMEKFQDVYSDKLQF
jgi:hypothetical protein